MEGLNHTIWDEWSALPAAQPVKDEIAGIIDGMSYSAEGEAYLFTSPRLFVVRRLMRLWGECEWSGSGGEGIRLIHTQQKGRIVFSIGRRAAAEVFSVTNAMATQMAT